MPNFLPRTLADEPGAPEGPVACPCGRKVPPDMLVDVRGLGPEVRKVARGGRFRNDAPEASHLCDGCRERAIREGRVERADLVEGLGAPAAVVGKIRRSEAKRRGEAE